MSQIYVPGTLPPGGVNVNSLLVWSHRPDKLLPIGFTLVEKSRLNANESISDKNIKSIFLTQQWTSFWEFWDSWGEWDTMVHTRPHIYVLTASCDRKFFRSLKIGTWRVVASSGPDSRRFSLAADIYNSSSINRLNVILAAMDVGVTVWNMSARAEADRPVGDSQIKNHVVTK